MRRTRTLIAAVLAVIHPGFGHVYLREWLRALAWFGLWLLAITVVSPPEALTAAWAGDPGPLLEFARSPPIDAMFTLMLIRGMNVIDAAWLALRSESPSSSTEGPACPNCGRELDADLDFCHWCTIPLDGTVDDSRAESGLL